jgi:transcriptional regulator with XRE-family HTH domain
LDKLNLEFICKRRMELGLTLQEMAEGLGFKNASTYLKYEKGDYSFKANHIPVLARKLRCTLDLLFLNNYLLKQKMSGEESAGRSRMKSQEANKRQLEIWRKTLNYEIEMMEPRSAMACEGFVNRLDHFEKQIEDRERLNKK